MCRGRGQEEISQCIYGKFTHNAQGIMITRRRRSACVHCVVQYWCPFYSFWSVNVINFGSLTLLIVSLYDNNVILNASAGELYWFGRLRPLLYGTCNTTWRQTWTEVELSQRTANLAFFGTASRLAISWRFMNFTVCVFFKISCLYPLQAWPPKLQYMPGTWRTSTNANGFRLLAF